MINKLPNSYVNFHPASVYKINGYTLQELLCNFYYKIDECINTSNESLTFLKWLKNEGLPKEVTEELNKMYLDGRLEEIINKLSGDLKKLVNDYKGETDTKLDDFTQLINNISDKTNVNTNSLNSLTNNINNVFINAKYPPLGLNPIVGDNQTDNTINLQKMIDFVGNMGGGEIVLPIGTHLISSIKLMDRVILKGCGRYSVLKSIDNNPDGCIIQLKTPRVIYTKLFNFTVDGNKDNQNIITDGILIDNSTAVNDARHIIQDMYIHSCNGDGLKLPTQSRENRIINTHIEKCNRNGLSMKGTDNFIVNCTCNHNVYNGFDFTNSYSNKVTSSKAFGNGKNGFNLNSSHNLQFSNVESQENGEHGLCIDNCNSFIGSSVVSDTNSVSQSLKFNGIEINNCRYLNIQAICSNNNLAGDGQKYAVHITGNTLNSSIIINGYSNTRPLLPYFEENKSITNNIQINGVTYSLKNLIDKNIYYDENKDGVADIFNEKYIHPTQLTGSFLISKENGCQRMLISSSLTNGAWNNVGLGKKININNGDKISAYCKLKVSDDSILATRLIVKWFNSDDGLIKDNVVYDNNTLVLDAVAPENTKYCKLMVELYPKVTGAVGYVDIYNFDYGII